ncbi:organic hydroperoxide resistance protein [Methyloligella sp. 2.7D]|uniref:organic hydroperoxide resistance protein n=1 Tax=unclassified Methyloligella TaxID=2625955 RepID=UPI00157D4A4C|nr:organic hydroperoxide resistance protein [Methyloligella sp. GL2]QKP76238.1 organic hydroperoxide resistance protein [Methyloligella sp. GL2]
MKTLYLATARAEGGRTGAVASSDGNLTLSLDTPKELGGSGGTGTNPEQLFAAGYAACFLSAVKFVASSRKLQIGEPGVTAQVGIGKREDGEGFALNIALRVEIPGLSRDEAQELIEQADLVCPYSELARNGAPVDLALA